MMQNHENTQPNGNLKISREVISTIAKYAALEVEGVASLASFTANLKGWLLRRKSAKPITIDLTDDVARIDLHINVKAGVKIPELAEKVQAAVKEAVQNMTGIAVSHVNIEISDIIFEKMGSELAPAD
ncbi:MAG: Asp23/Gls24 family envelope stress response protein [Oscillospiraceae bacterium]|jgi:uncharacterized alkaline shock family protein YloU|nr:Asp23/Gls24 family envelope stress response protein [Oscillospiraceae bacterium]MCI9363554.1 Asp23/Gls24 family envelope stress response protein [Oscillospiraceae bacterium]RKJ55698.1 Asp23/Gls24 family envelope stress response protein [bacterium 1XD42-8]RKJ64228.1 Asp23/Gls24 family envelope stress response protein [bacterium 1XD42-1]